MDESTASSTVNEEDDSEDEFDLEREDKRCQFCLKINGRKPLIQCTQCGSQYHISCVKVSKLQKKAFERYSCPRCRNVPFPFPDRQPLNVDNQTTFPDRQPLNDDNQSTADFDLLQYLKKCKSNLSVINNIPRGARIVAADALNNLINDVLQSNTSLSWSKLLCFTYHGLQKPKKDKHSSNSPSLVSKMKDQISVFMNSNFPPEGFPFQLRDKRAKQKSKEEILKNRVNAKFSENDLKGAIRELSSDDTLAPDNSDTLKKLEERHPAAPTGISLPPAPENDETHIPVTTDSVKKAILSFPAGSAAGPDGLKPGHLKSLIGAVEAGNRLLESITKLVNFVLKDKIPEDIRPIFFGANLCALSKKDGGIRPIAVGTTFRRLITKAGLKPISKDLGILFRPNQLGYSSKGGSEAAAHAARHYLTSNIQNKVFLKLDIKNAFNCMNRDVILQKVKEKIPSLFNLLWQAYSKPSHLFYRDNILSSETGLQQGDPGGPALFSLGINDIIIQLKSEVNLWYLDDSNMADSPQVVLEDLRLLLRELKRIGLSINGSKCELTCLNLDDSNSAISDFKELLPGLKITSIDESIILGSPIAAQGVQTELNSKLNALEIMTSRLNIIDPHQAFVLLKHSFAIPKMTYLLRSSPAYQQVDLLNNFDTTIRNSMSKITNIDFTDEAWDQLSLPVRYGGLGIRKSADIALPAYISSALSANSLVEAIIRSVIDLAPFEVNAEIEMWKASGQELTEPDDESCFKQRAWDAPRIEPIQKNLLRNADQFGRARLKAAAQPESGSWITAIPVPNLGTQLSPDELRIAIALRTGSKICENYVCKCKNKIIVDEYGFHPLSCQYNEGRHPRHTAINDIICRALKSSGTAAVLEPNGLNRGDGRRPDGITIFPFSQGKALCWDATCVNTFALSLINKTAIEAGSAATAAENTKRRNYPEMVSRFRFEPIAIETSGAFGHTTRKIVNEIGKRISEKTGDKRETTWLKQRISIAIQRGNALSILASAKHMMTGYD